MTSNELALCVITVSDSTHRVVVDVGGAANLPIWEPDQQDGTSVSEYRNKPQGGIIAEMNVQVVPHNYSIREPGWAAGSTGM